MLKQVRSPLLLFCVASILSFVCLADAFARDELSSQELNPSQPEVVKERARKEMKESAKPKPAGEPAIQTPPEPQPPPVPEGPRFVLSEAAVEGNTVLSKETLKAVIAPYQGKEVAVKDLQELAQKVQQKYRSQGYLTTLAFLPPQRIQAGKVKIQVVEGRFGDLVIEGNRYFKEAQFRREWPIPKGEVLRYQKLRRAIQQMNTNPDRKVQALLRPGTVTGTTDVVLKVTDQRPLHASLFADNQGTPPIGIYRGGWSVQHNNLLRHDDRAVIGMVGGRTFGAGFGQYSYPLNSYGSRLTLSATHAQVAPQRQFKPFGVNGTSETYGVFLEQPVISTDRSYISAKAGVDFSQNRTKVLAGVSRRDRLRVVRLEPDGRFTDSLGVWQIDPEFSFGIKGLGAMSENNPVSSRAGARPDFQKVRLDLTRIQRMPLKSQLILNVVGQLAASKLTPQEEMSLGGAASVRGYPEGDYLADQAVLGRLEVDLPLFFLPESWHLPASPAPVKEAVQWIGFFDRGYGRLRAITGDESASRNPMGAGVGLKFQGYGSFSARIECGFVLGDPALTSDSNYQIHLRVQNDF